jgi:S-formylglutathione hydrolase FrmB
MAKGQFRSSELSDRGYKDLYGASRGDAKRAAKVSRGSDAYAKQKAKLQRERELHQLVMQEARETRAKSRNKTPVQKKVSPQPTLTPSTPVGMMLPEDNTEGENLTMNPNVPEKAGFSYPTVDWGNISERVKRFMRKMDYQRGGTGHRTTGRIIPTTQK